MLPAREQDELRLRAKMQIRELREEFNQARMRGRDAQLYENSDSPTAEVEHAEGDADTEEGLVATLQEVAGRATGEATGIR